MTSNENIENIQKNTNIVDIISSYLPLTQKGKNYFGVCPFHEDHSPSMSVSEEKQIYKCFSCGAAGNVFTFVSDYENVSFIEAVKIVAEKSGLNFVSDIRPKKQESFKKQEYEIMSLALKYYQNNLNTKEGEIAKNYLKERALNDDAIKEFDIGLALGKEHNLHDLLLKKNYPLKTLEDLGLINANGSNINDIFNYRIMFPIHDLEGNVIGFTGRIYNNSDQAKYINSKETSIFKKGEILFNYHRAKNAIKKNKTVIIVEGNMDAIRLSINGIKNVVALMGTSLTKNQINILKNLRAKIILMLDNDDAGEDATFNNGNILEKAGLDPLIIRLSGEKDPDSYIIKNGIDAIKNNLSKPLSFLEFKIRYLKKNKDLSKTEDLVKYIKDLVASLKDIDDELTKKLTLKKISDEYDISLDLLENELKKIEVPKKVEPPKKENKISLSKYDIAHLSIIYFMLNDLNYIERFKKEIGYFTIRKYRDIVNEILYYYDKNNSIDISSFLTFVKDEEEIYNNIKEMLRVVNIDDLSLDNFEEIKKVLETERKKLEIKELKEAIMNELDADKKIILVNRLVELKKDV
ncbi:MAG: DNA primase [Ruminococcus sp.]|nr:DNA primase [Ruminococcus sp.]